MKRVATYCMIIGGVVAGMFMKANAQISAVTLQSFLESPANQRSLPLQYPQQVKEFYRAFHYNPAWVNQPANRTQLLHFLRQATALGLRETDYQDGFVKPFVFNTLYMSSNRDSLTAELRCTDAAIHFFRDIMAGNETPFIGYNGLNYTPDCNEVPVLLADALQKGRFNTFLQQTEPASASYKALKDWLTLMLEVYAGNDFKEVRVTSSRIDSTNQPLIVKLYQLGIIDSLNKKYTNAALRQKLLVAQGFLGLTPDGLLSQGTKAVLNVSLAARIEALKRALNTVRWLQCLQKKGPVIVVNIPSASLLLYENSDVVFDTKIIVGKKTTPTPTLLSTINEVVLYPYWNVPAKIASRELLPLIKRDRGYLDANNLQVLNMQGKVVDAAAIDWSSLSADNFPYMLRQSTGCDNSLGIIKFNFYSPYGVYLHDTPWKVLFNLNKRYFSHGCMRVEKAIGLSHWILKGNSIAIDTLEEKGCLPNQKPIVVPATVKANVCVVYNTAWFDRDANVRFYEDVYNKY